MSCAPRVNLLSDPDLTHVHIMCACKKMHWVRQRSEPIVCLTSSNNAVNPAAGSKAVQQSKCGKLMCKKARGVDLRRTHLMPVG